MPLPPPPPPPPPLAMVGPPRWRDQRALSVALTALFCAMVAVSVLLGIALANRIAVVRDFKTGHFANLVQRAEDADDFVNGASALFGFTELVIIVVFIIWMFRAAKNNEALGRHGARFSPGWSVGSWFIPLANFVIPVLIMQDLWRGSDFRRGRGDPDWRRASASALVGWWWAFLLLSIVRFSPSESGFHGTGSLDDIETSNTIALAGVVATAITAVLALLVVRALSHRQLDTLHVQRSEYDAI